MWYKALTFAALPVYQIRNAVAYAGTRDGWIGKVWTFATFLPVIVITTAIWAFIWAVGLRLLWQLVR
jgi:hypothetical protein